MEYTITPRVPGVRPQDPPDYDGITFVYLFTYVVDPWVVPAQLQNVVLVVENAQGFLSGMSIIIEGAGSFEVVSTDVLNRMTVQNLGYSQNAAPGTGIAPGKITTTSLPGPQGDTGIQGIPGVAATVTAGQTTTTPAGQNANVTNSGTPNAAVFDFSIPRGPTGPGGPQGAPGQAYNNVTTAAFTAANPPTVQTLSLNSTTGLAAGVTLNIDPIGYYKVTGVISGTQVSVVNTGTASNAAAGTVSPSGSAVLGTGPQGPPGNAATVAVGTTTTGAPGSNASVTNIGSTSAAVLNFTVPQGAVGAQGIQGPAGANGAPGTAATVVAGTTTTGAPGSQASVNGSGTPTNQVFNFTIPRGDVGAAGAAGAQGPPGTAGSAGAPGAAATATAGTTSTSLPGTNANVVNAGSTSAAVFNFTIPRGDVGAQGPAGATGPTGLPAWTLTGADFTVPAIGSTVVVAVNDTSWAVVGEFVWVATAGGSANMPMALQITAKTATTVTLLNPPTSGTAPSGDANNLLAVGSDSLLYLPPSAIQPTIWNVRLRSFNAVGNPTFEVAQRNCRGALTPVGAAMLEDRWSVANAGTLNATFQTFQTGLGAGQGVVVPGTNFIITTAFLRITVGTVKASLAAADSCYIQQNIEGPQFRELMSDVHSCSLLVRSNVANLKFGMALRDPTGSRSLTKLCTCAATANTFTLIPLPNLPIWPSAGTFTAAVGSTGYLLNLCVASGSTMLSPANDTWQNGNFIAALGQDNLFATSGGIFEAFFIQHEPVPQCSTLIDQDFQTNLERCKRYYQKSWDYAIAVGTAGGSGYGAFYPDTTAAPSAYGPLRLVPEMAKQPTLTPWSNGTPSAGSAFQNGINFSATLGGSPKQISTLVNSGGNFGNLRVVTFNWTADTGW